MIPKRTLLAWAVACCCMGSLQAVSAADSLPVNGAYSDSTTIEVYQRKEVHIQLGSKATPNGIITLRSQTNTPVHFYVFDMEGTLLYQTHIANKEEKTISKLNKGAYLYDVFKNDECVERGKIIVK